MYIFPLILRYAFSSFEDISKLETELFLCSINNILES